VKRPRGTTGGRRAATHRESTRKPPGPNGAPPRETVRARAETKVVRTSGASAEAPLPQTERERLQVRPQGCRSRGGNEQHARGRATRKLQAPDASNVTVRAGYVSAAGPRQCEGVRPKGTELDTRSREGRSPPGQKAHPLETNRCDLWHPPPSPPGPQMGCGEPRRSGLPVTTGRSGQPAQRRHPYGSVPLGRVSQVPGSGVGPRCSPRR
jgi:hypothetical protein